MTAPFHAKGSGNDWHLSPYTPYTPYTQIDSRTIRRVAAFSGYPADVAAAIHVGITGTCNQFYLKKFHPINRVARGNDSRPPMEEDKCLKLLNIQTKLVVNLIGNWKRSLRQSLEQGGMTGMDASMEKLFLSKPKSSQRTTYIRSTYGRPESTHQQTMSTGEDDCLKSAIPCALRLEHNWPTVLPRLQDCHIARYPCSSDFGRKWPLPSTLLILNIL
ncbi:hypothetical protein J6590_038789 [Homalodisca vitripennis]|nr:hypothetical protein J6590_038789 [Homalodisca vitripennis]